MKHLSTALLATALSVSQEFPKVLVPVRAVRDAAIVPQMMRRDTDDEVGLGVASAGLVTTDPGAAARSFCIVRIAMVETNDLRVPALHQLAELDLDHLAIADRNRIADLRHLIVGAPPIVLPAEMAQILAAAQLDHGEVPGPARFVG